MADAVLQGLAAGAGLMPPEATRAMPRPPRTIVPLWGLPIVAAILIGEVFAIASNSFWALDFYHVVGGGIWTAIDLFVGLVIGPIIGTLPTAARAAFSARFMPKMSLIMPTL